MQIGDNLFIFEIGVNLKLRIVIGGPKRSGKSTFCLSLWKALEKMGKKVGCYEIDVYSDSHRVILGEIKWEERCRKKWAWFNPTIKKRIEEFEADQHEIVLGDLPGKITNPFLPQMTRSAEAAIIISLDLKGIESWEKFFRKRRIRVIARYLSLSGPPLEFKELEDELRKNQIEQVCGLLEGKLQPDNPVIIEAASKLIDLIKKG